jgi:hypothetical protein
MLLINKTLMVEAEHILIIIHWRVVWLRDAATKKSHVHFQVAKSGDASLRPCFT